MRCPHCGHAWRSPSAAHLTQPGTPLSPELRATLAGAVAQSSYPATARRLGVSVGSLSRWIKGGNASAANHERVSALLAAETP